MTALILSMYSTIIHCLTTCTTRLLQDRWKDSQDDKPQQQQQFLPGFNGFGGGRYHCPGRWFALMELQLVVAMTIKMFDMQLLDTIPQPVSTASVQSCWVACCMPFNCYPDGSAECTPASLASTMQRTTC